MAISSDVIQAWLSNYDPEGVTIGVVASHSAFRSSTEHGWRGSGPLASLWVRIEDDSAAPSLVLTLMNGLCSTITMTCSITPNG